MIAIALLSLAMNLQLEQVSSQDQRDVVEAVITHLETDYVSASVGEEAAHSLREDLNAGYWSASQNAADFAQALGAKLRELTGDGHLDIEHSTTPLDLDPAQNDEAYNASQMERWYGAHINFGVQTVQRLDGNIGYLDLRVFPPLEMGGDTLSGAMAVLAQTNALILDLRHNGGGITDAAIYVMSHLFEAQRQPLTGIYDRPSDTLTQYYTWPHLDTPRFGADKPVYILTSDRTFSAAEQLAYDLQALGRAVIVGEVTGGGAHPFSYRPIHRHFVLSSVTARSVNPITQTNWQGVGVQPDLVCDEEEALNMALAHLEHSGN